MSMSQMNITTKHTLQTNIPKLSMCNQQSIIPRHIERGIHWSTNQTPHSPQLEFKFDPLKIPSGVAILWTPYFAQCVPIRWRNSLFILFGEILIFRKRLGVATYFCFIFLREKQNKKEKNPKCDSWRKNRSTKNRVWIQGSGYLLGMYDGEP